MGFQNGKKRANFEDERWRELKNKNLWVSLLRDMACEATHREVILIANRKNRDFKINAGRI